MGLFDSIKSKISGNKDTIKQGVDKGADMAADKLPDHADKVDKGAEMAKDAVDKLPD